MFIKKEPYKNNIGNVLGVYIQRYRYGLGRHYGVCLRFALGNPGSVAKSRPFPMLMGTRLHMAALKILCVVLPM